MRACAQGSAGPVKEPLAPGGVGGTWALGKAGHREAGHAPLVEPWESLSLYQGWQSVYMSLRLLKVSLRPSSALRMTGITTSILQAAFHFVSQGPLGSHVCRDRPF